MSRNIFFCHTPPQYRLHICIINTHQTIRNTKTHLDRFHAHLLRVSITNA